MIIIKAKKIKLKHDLKIFFILFAFHMIKLVEKDELRIGISTPPPLNLLNVFYFFPIRIAFLFFLATGIINKKWLDELEDGTTWCSKNKPNFILASTQFFC